MPIIKANISPDDLLQAILQLNRRELDTFIDQVIAFQAHRVSYLAQLARLHGKFLTEMRADLGIKTPDHE